MIGSYVINDYDLRLERNLGTFVRSLGGKSISNFYFGKMSNQVRIRDDELCRVRIN